MDRPRGVQIVLVSFTSHLGLYIQTEPIICIITDMCMSVFSYWPVFMCCTPAFLRL